MLFDLNLLSGWMFLFGDDSRASLVYQYELIVNSANNIFVNVFNVYRRVRTFVSHSKML